MREGLGQEHFGKRRTDYAPLDLEADWSYLRANLDHPAHRVGSRLGSGLTAWLARHFQASSSPPPQLSILARIALGPRQSLALVEAEGVHVLVGIASDGPPSFFPLAQDSGCNEDRSPNRADSVLTGTDSDARQPVYRAFGLEAGQKAGQATGMRPLSRPRLTGRVSWV